MILNRSMTNILVSIKIRLIFKKRFQDKEEIQLAEGELYDYLKKKYRKVCKYAR